jgi:5-methylcytosine-specific restriction enzyme A
MGWTWYWARSMPHRVPTYRASVPTASRHQEYDCYARDPQSKRFYSSVAWQKLRGMKLRRDPLCAECSKRGQLTPATHAHHVIEVQDDQSLRLELDNLQSLCSSCHSRLHASRPDPAK